MRSKNWYWMPLFGFGFIVLLVIASLITMVLWNMLIPMLFHGPIISFWQTVGLLILLRILFHSGGHRHYGRYGWHGRYHQRRREHFEQKFASMTPEEREKFKEEWKQRCRPKYWERWHAYNDYTNTETEKKDSGNSGN